MTAHVRRAASPGAPGPAPDSRRPFDLPPELEAATPRGPGHDQRRGPDARRPPGRRQLVHSTFSELPRFLDEGDLVVINTSGTLAAAVDAGRSPRAARGGPSLDHAPRRSVDRRAAPGRPALVRARDRAGAGSTGGGRVELLAAVPRAHARGVRLWVTSLDALARCTPTWRCTVIPSATGTCGAAGPSRLPERLRHRARIGRDAQCRSALHPRGPDPAGGPGRGRRPDRPPHRGGLRSRRPSRPTPSTTGCRRPRPIGSTTRHRDGGRVIAIGTTVVRALETVVDPTAQVHAGSGWTDTVVTPEHPVTSGVDGMLTGWHEPEASHLAMLEAIAGRAAARALLRRRHRRGVPVARVRRRPSDPAVTPVPLEPPAGDGAEPPLAAMPTTRRAS